MADSGKSKNKNPWFLLLAAAVWLAVWQFAYWLIGRDLLLASPLQVGSRLAELAMQGSFWATALMSLLRIMAGFGLGLLAGTALAVLTARSAVFLAVFQPAISAIRATPVASFIILALVWMSSSRVVIFIVFLMVMPVIWANVTEGIRKTDPQLLEMARVFGFTRSQVVRLIYIPSISPFFAAAATTGLGLGWKAGIAAEVLSTPRLSLGGELYNAKIYLETADLLAYTVVVILLSLLLEKLLLIALHRIEAYFRRHGRIAIGKGGGEP